MHIQTATRAKQHFGALLDRVQKSPVLVKKSGRKVAVMLSFEEYEQIISYLERLDDSYWIARAQEADTQGLLSIEKSKKFLDAFLKK